MLIVKCSKRASPHWLNSQPNVKCNSVSINIKWSMLGKKQKVNFIHTLMRSELSVMIQKWIMPFLPLLASQREVVGHCEKQDALLDSSLVWSSKLFLWFKVEDPLKCETSHSVFWSHPVIQLIWLHLCNCLNIMGTWFPNILCTDYSVWTVFG